MKNVLLLAAGIFSLLLETSLSGIEIPLLTPWTLDYPTLPGGRLNSAAWGADRCVAVGQNGRILYSTTGTSWDEAEPLVLPTFTDWQDVTYGNGRYVAVGGNYTTTAIASSDDGITWNAIVTENPGFLRSVSYGDGGFVVVGEGLILSSPDGSNWQTKATSPDFVDLTQGNGVWLAIDRDGRSYSSTNLATWTGTWSSPYFPYDENTRGIAFGNGRFVSVGGYSSQGSGTSASILKWSADGRFWRSGTADHTDGIWGVQTGITFANGYFVAVGASTPDIGYRSLLRSTDGEIWTRGSITFPHTVSGYVTGVAGKDGKPFVAVSTTGEILISTDGLAWKPVDNEPREYFNRLHNENGLYVALAGQSGSIGGPPGRSVIFTSPDGANWTPQLPAIDEHLSGIAHGNGLWVVTGDDGRILTSPDAMNWTDRSLPATTNDLRNLAFGNGRFVALSINRDRIYHSTDGITWILLDQPFGDGPGAVQANAIEFLNGRFRVVGSEGLLATSADGLRWQSSSIHPTADFQSIAYGKGRFVIGGYYHHAVADGEGPFTTFDADDDTVSPDKIIYSNGWFISSTSRLSRNGVHWSEKQQDRNFPFYGRWEHALTTGDRLIACSGLEIRSLSFAPPTPTALALGKGAEFLTRSTQDHRILSSPDLSDWAVDIPWRRGTDDYLVIPENSTATRKFWKMETRPASP